MHFLLRCVVRFVTLSIGAVFGVPALFRLLWALIRNPSALTPRQSPQPAVLYDPSLGNHGFLEGVNGQRIHFVENGPKDAPLILFLHGFPNCWFVWKYQLLYFSGRYRTVAIDMRGYGESSKPSASWFGSDAYTLETLTSDVAGVITQLGYTSCVLVGHDWGSIVAWAFADKYGAMVDRLVCLNCPHPSTFRKNMSIKQFFRSWYMFLFQLPLLPELLLSLDNFAIVKAMMKVQKLGGMAKGTISEEECTAFRWSMAQPGSITCALNYYRSAFVNSARYGTIQCPTLIVWGEKDFALGTELIQGTSPRYAKDLKVVMLPEASHWVPWDDPQGVNEAIEGFLVGKAV